ncbi:proline-rich receptor-like protein kinase PERK9 [Iris pallida]|uniref:Proline-rich receptor-like protein kinase PERK9 n=1 Tax=Iris pallida TaxID=29817 RepID=A0AAX6GUB8_IRIPA|nr:proline-rich receptor-like protein kinase PERK9 [Iris pallida]
MVVAVLRTRQLRQWRWRGLRCLWWMWHFWRGCEKTDCGGAGVGGRRAELCLPELGLGLVFLEN